jgi:glycosyltransferase involved in cell wall biosynthesis
VLNDQNKKTVPISLCICTRHRPDDLRLCLQAAFGGEVLPAQVIVSDDGDEGRTVQHLVEEFAGAQYVEGPKRGLAANRNACIDAATTPWIAFIDDDVLLPPDFFQKAMSFVGTEAERKDEIISGTEWKHVGDQVHHIFPGNADFWGFQRVTPTPGQHRCIVINATVFPSSLFKQARFDEHLRYGCEEIDMARHAVSLGYRIDFQPTLTVDHYPSTINRGEYAKVVDASRLYAAGKAHWKYDHSLPKALAYFLLAPPREVIANARRRGAKGAIQAVKALVLAGGYTLANIRGR